MQDPRMAKMMGAIKALPPTVNVSGIVSDSPVGALLTVDLNLAVYCAEGHAASSGHA